MGASDAMMSAWCCGSAAMTAYWICRAWACLNLTEPEVVALVLLTARIEHARREVRGIDSVHPSDPPTGP